MKACRFRQRCVATDSLVRCPQGHAKKCFFQKHDAGSFGDAVKHVCIEEKDGALSLPRHRRRTPDLRADGTIEFHGGGSRIEDVEKADRLVFDLDPDEDLDFEAVRRAAFHFRDILKSIGLQTFPMVMCGTAPRRCSSRRTRPALRERRLGSLPAAAHWTG